MNRVRLTLVLSSGLLLGGCSFIPVLNKPAPPVADQWGAHGVVTNPAAELLSWPQYFPDERLQALIRASLAHNRDLRVAILNIEQARAQLTVQRADLFPTLNASVNATRQPSSSAPYQVGTVASGGLALASFELDLFGRVRALSEAASAQLLGTQASSQTTQISLVASVASAYYSLWAD
ncbi:MAG TPA: TolC family protein, partial [Aquabacterium sp.]|nr:TolC family protein [Aquabacterium sp.]